MASWAKDAPNRGCTDSRGLSTLLHRFTRAGVLFAITAIALLVCYAPALRGMAEQWFTDEDMGHGFLVPLVIVWIIWRERDQWRTLPTAPSLWGLALLLAGALLQCISVLGAGLFAACLGLLITIVGVVLCLGGVAFLRRSAFLFVLSLFMLPKLAIVYQRTLPLELLASHLAAGVLSFAGVGVVREGNILSVGGHRVLVAEACNGLRYLLPLGFVALLLGYLAQSRLWMRVALFLSAIPLAIGGNAIRVAVSACFPALSQGAPHSIGGWSIFVLCLIALVVLRRLFESVNALYA